MHSPPASPHWNLSRVDILEVEVAHDLEPKLPFDVIDVLSPLIGYRGCIRTHGEHVLEQVLQLAPWT